MGNSIAAVFLCLLAVSTEFYTRERKDFYIEDESGNLVQREFVGTESKSETEALLRKAMEEYEEKKFIAKSENATAVLQGAFRFAVFPKRLITFNPMQYVIWRGKKEDYDLFSDEDGDTASTPTLSHEQYLKLEEFLKRKDNPALLPIQNWKGIPRYYFK